MNPLPSLSVAIVAAWLLRQRRQRQGFGRVLPPCDDRQRRFRLIALSYRAWEN